MDQGSGESERLGGKVMGTCSPSVRSAAAAGWSIDDAMEASADSIETASGTASAGTLSAGTGAGATDGAGAVSVGTEAGATSAGTGAGATDGAGAGSAGTEAGATEGLSLSRSSLRRWATATP